MIVLLQLYCGDDACAEVATVQMPPKRYGGIVLRHTYKIYGTGDLSHGNRVKDAMPSDGQTHYVGRKSHVVRGYRNSVHTGNLS